MYFPHFHSILEKISSEILIIGAGVFGLYEAQGWVPSLKRKTGDLDLSVSLISGMSDYETLREELLKYNYTQEETEPPYRYFSPKRIPNQPSYIDLLAHPGTPKVSKAMAIQAMGAGPEFSFDGLEFAQLSRYQIVPKVYYPNPIGFISLKQISYLDDPIRRRKDLADIVELVYGLVQRGEHFKIHKLWDKIKSHPMALKIREMLVELGSDNSARWDLYDVRSELLGRGFDIEEMDNTIPSSLIEFVSYLEQN